MTNGMMNYSGPFINRLDLAAFNHDVLAQYGREIMLANHIHDRAALLQVTLKYGTQAQTDVACDEWMGSSPIYNARNRTMMKMDGHDVATALKSLQLDIGAPHNFLALHYQVKSPTEGFFWTTTCGPYNHVRRMTNADPKMETQICHHMEDPTFDATVMAVNPRMRCRPVFRPPYNKVPESGPCRWRVSIERDIGLVEDNPILAIVQQSLAATFQFAPIHCDEQGMRDYKGELKEDFTLNDLSHSVLVRQCKEFALDVHLLNRACYSSIAQRWDADALVPLAIEQWHCMAPVTVHRLRKTFSIAGNDMSAVLKILQLNPFLPPEYLNLGFELIDERLGRVWVEDCAALRETMDRGIVSLLTHHPETPGFSAMAAAVNPKARVKSLDPNEIPAAKIAWEVVIDPNAPPLAESKFAALIAGDDLIHLDNSTHQYSYN